MSTPTNEQREAEIRERLSKRTPGTWKAEYITDPRGDDGGYNIIGAAGDMIANDTFGWCIDEPDDAALIANAPADLSWLLSRIEELAKDRKALLDRQVRPIVENGVTVGFCVMADYSVLPQRPMTNHATADEALAAYRASSSGANTP